MTARRTRWTTLPRRKACCLRPAFPLSFPPHFTHSFLSAPPFLSFAFDHDTAHLRISTDSMRCIITLSKRALAFFFSVCV